MGKCYISKRLDEIGRNNIDINFFYDPMIGNYIIPKCEMTTEFWNQFISMLDEKEFDNYGKGYCMFTHIYDDTDENGNDIKVESWVLANMID